MIKYNSTSCHSPCDFIRHKQLNVILILLTHLIFDSAAGTPLHLEAQALTYKGQQQSKPATQPNQQLMEQTEEVDLNASIVKLYNEGKYDEAIPLAKQVLAIREKSNKPDDLLVANALNNLGALYMAKGKYSDAEPLYKKSLKIKEAVNGTDHLSLAPILDNLALISYVNGSHGATEKLYQRALSVREKHLGPSHSNVMKSLSRLADFYQIRGAFHKAEPLLQRVMAEGEKVRGATSSGLGESLYQYACLKRKMKQTEEAKKLEAGAREVMNPDSSSRSEPLEGGVINGKAIQMPLPYYPPEALRARQSGTVTVQILIDETGKVIQACAISGPSVLWRAAEQAAYHATFTPTLLSGKPVKATGVITYNFVLR